LNLSLKKPKLLEFKLNFVFFFFTLKFIQTYINQWQCSYQGNTMLSDGSPTSNNITNIANYGSTCTVVYLIHIFLF